MDFSISMYVVYHVYAEFRIRVFADLDLDFKNPDPDPSVFCFNILYSENINENLYLFLTNNCNGI